MRTVCVHDKGLIERFLRRDAPLHAYELGDLDEAFWPFTTWYGLKDETALRALALVYSGLSLPTLLALSNDVRSALPELLGSILPLLPRAFYAHLSPGLETTLGKGFRLEPRGIHHKMALRDPSRLTGADAVRLSEIDAPELLEFYRESYPGNWFEPSVLRTGQYFGVRSDGVLACVAGVHVYSPRTKVAALGNIATRPAFRRRGLARTATAALCRSLLRSVSDISLNVAAGNAAAIRCYEKLGFEAVASYGEFEASPQR